MPLEDYLFFVYSNLIAYRKLGGNNIMGELLTMVVLWAVDNRSDVVFTYASSEEGAEESSGNAGIYGSRRHSSDNERILWSDH